MSYRILVIQHKYEFGESETTEEVVRYVTWDEVSECIPTLSDAVTTPRLVIIENTD